MESRKFSIDAIKPIPIKKRELLCQHEQIIASMYKKAEEHGREPLDDIFRLISIYYTHGTNIDKILESSFITNELRESLTTLKNIYGLKSTSAPFEFCPTVSRVTEAFPHVSLVIADMLNSAPSGSRLRFCVSSKDLGAEVHFHFKMNYFPSLIDSSASWKAQIALLVHNLCHSKSIINTSGKKDIGTAFAKSCKFSAKMRDLRLAPADARQKFTEYIIESFNFDADSLSVVWDAVIGETKIPFLGTMITDFHEIVLNQQPLNLSTWRDLLKQIGLN